MWKNGHHKNPGLSDDFDLEATTRKVKMRHSMNIDVIVNRLGHFLLPIKKKFDKYSKVIEGVEMISRDESIGNFHLETSCSLNNFKVICYLFKVCYWLLDCLETIYCARRNF